MEALTWTIDHQTIVGKNRQGEILAKATWHVVSDGTRVVNHTRVDERLQGQGIASEMMKQIAEHFRAKGQKTSASCSYAQAWYQKNKDAYQDILKL